MVFVPGTKALNACKSCSKGMCRNKFVCTVQGAVYDCILAASVLKLPLQLFQCSSETRVHHLKEEPGTLDLVRCAAVLLSVQAGERKVIIVGSLCDSERETALIFAADASTD